MTTAASNQAHAAAAPSTLDQRSYEPELMDDFSIHGSEVDLALRELRVINKYLGGVSSSLAALKPLLRARRNAVSILDLGCGGADIPVAIARWCRRARIAAHIGVIDLGGDACRFAREATRAYPEIQVYRGDVLRLPFAPKSFDFVHCSLFLHHFTQDEIVRILRSVSNLAREAIVINDLHRNAIAYHAIRLLTRCFSRSRLVRYDAPLSVRRAFRADDWDEIQRRCGFRHFTYRWRWAFRYVCHARIEA